MIVPELARVTNSARLFTPGETKALAESKVHQISRAWVTNDGWSIEIINNTRGGIVMFIQAKKGNASNGGQIQVPDAELRRLTVLFIVYNIFIKMNILLFIYSLFMLRSNGYFTRKILFLHCFFHCKTLPRCCRYF